MQQTPRLLARRTSLEWSDVWCGWDTRLLERQSFPQPENCSWRASDLQVRAGHDATIYKINGPPLPGEV